MPNPLLIVIVGPTAAGKTALSIKLAEKYNTEIVSADSRQFYKEMEIGTAKPTADELMRVKHHFINNLSVRDEYNAGRYEKEAIDCLDNIFKKEDKAIMVGGSGLFINAVCNGFDALPEGDNALREHYEKLLRQKGIEALQAELKEKDPAYYDIVDKKNHRRLIRALEVYGATGKPYSLLRKKQGVKRHFEVIKIGIAPDKQELVKRIEERIDSMLASGWLEECRSLFSLRHMNALKTVGYTELFNFIEGKNNWEDTVQHIKTNTWHYAKRQLTWFKKDKEVKWFIPGQEEQILVYIGTFIAS